MSRVRDVIKSKNRLERSQRTRRKEELNSLRMSSAFRAMLYDEFKKLDILLESDEIECIVITIPDVFIAQFGEAIYSEDLAEYDIRQIEDMPNQFSVKHKYIDF